MSRCLQSDKFWLFSISGETVNLNQTAGTSFASPADEDLEAGTATADEARLSENQDSALVEVDLQSGEAV